MIRTLIFFLGITSPFTQTSNDCEKIYTIVEVQPEYKGGTGDLFKYIQMEVLPELKCMGEEKTQITSLRIQFIIDVKGNVSNVLFPNESKLTALCKSKMEKRLFAMKGWVPAKINGRSVCSQFDMPFRCLLWE